MSSPMQRLQKPGAQATDLLLGLNKYKGLALDYPGCEKCVILYTKDTRVKKK